MNHAHRVVIFYKISPLICCPRCFWIKKCSKNLFSKYKFTLIYFYVFTVKYIFMCGGEYVSYS
ncbi:membrane protein [Candidatus Magnetobacterium bavaricum]|uniref:Membrane protein n=1 Tax=Candidatus Magnetobacterium bavaricum TaxID=29290 RepID=A0A0F3GPK0_9BACT|nr:membrane protein [Candidatus Magnetobacterium bavaricum]